MIEFAWPSKFSYFAKFITDVPNLSIPVFVIFIIIKITKTGIERLGTSVINLAKYENLDGHANSIKIRLKKVK